ncbi:MAG: hypothetical protein AAGH88_11045 [Planctomycetota bacterium]
MIQRIALLYCALAGLVLFTGCSSSYVVAPTGADMSELGMSPAVSPATRRAQTDSDIARALSLKPLAQFPTTIAVVRVQKADESSRKHGVSFGRSSLEPIPERTVETDEQLATLRALPEVRDAARLNRLVLGAARTDRELRAAAAKIHADLLLVYTINTAVYREDQPEPINVVHLGLFSTREYRVESTVTALLLGTHNGYVYATAEVIEEQGITDNAWRNERQIKQTVEQLEQLAFDELVGSFVSSWPQLVAAHSGTAVTP